MVQWELRRLRNQKASRRDIIRVLRRLYELEGLQSWRDYQFLGEHLLKTNRSAAREVLQDGLEQLKGKPRSGKARKALKELLARATPRAAAPGAESRTPARPGGAVKGSRGQERRHDGTAAAGEAEDQSSPAVAPAPGPLDRADDDVPLRLSIRTARDAGLAPALAAAEDAGLARHRLTLLAHGVLVADRFDHLLCLDSLRGVEHFEHQLETVKRVLRVLRGRALLADEVGLGKTIEAAMVLSECLHRSLVESVLILVPAALVGQWREELSTKFGIDAATTEDADYRADPNGFWTRHQRIIASLELARRRGRARDVTARRYDLVIVDEAHRLKRSTTQGYKLVDRLQSRFLLLLTATPVENNLEELFNIITLLRPGQLSTRAAFKREFVSRGDPTSPRNPERLRVLLAEVMIRNTRALVDLRLPPRFASTVRCEPAAAERELYACIRDIVSARYGQGRDRLAVSTLMQTAGSSPGAVRATARKMLSKPDLDPGLDAQLRRVENLTRSTVQSAKAGRLVELLRAAADQGDKAVVFTRYLATLEYLEELMDWHSIPHACFSGRMTGPEKDAAVARLQDEVGVMLATEVGGEGRNLQCASTLINFDLPWNPMKLEQRIGRLHRIGQIREVRIFNLCAAGSAEDRILDVLDRRINMFELVVGELDMILGQLQDERNFGERVLEIYGTSGSEQEVQERFHRLGDTLEDARGHYERAKQLDLALFGQDYEV